MAKVTSINKTKNISFGDIKDWYEKNMSPDVIDLNDQEVYEYVYHQGRWAGIFQCTSNGAQKFFMKAKPESIIDIAALTSIYRPGPLAANVDKLWLKHKDEPYDWGHPLINETLKETRGCLVFQEGVMSLANKVAGFPMAETDEVRRAIMKRSISGGEAAKQKAKELENSFVDGAKKNGVPESIGRKAYENILYFSGYGFNKSLHSSQQIVIYNLDRTIKAILPIEDITPGDYVLSRDESSGNDLLVEVLEKHDHGFLELVEVELTTGEKIKCTLDHKFRTVETGEMLPLWLIEKRNLSIVTSQDKELSGDVNINSSDL